MSSDSALLVAEMVVSPQLLTFMLSFLLLTDEKPYVCSLCDFVTSDLKAYTTHVRVRHPAASDRPSPGSSSLDRVASSGYSKLKKALLQGLNITASPPVYLDPGATPVDLCVRTEGSRVALDQDQKNLPSHKCSFCSHSTRYPEVLWMHQTVAHRINSSSSSIAPKWALKNCSKGSRDKLSSPSWRRTGPPPVLEGKECPPLTPPVRFQRTRPPSNSGDVSKRSKPSGQPASSSSSSSTSSSSLSRGSSTLSGGRAPTRSSRQVEEQSHQPPSRPKLDTYNQRRPSSSSSSSDKSSHSRSAAPSHSPASTTGSRMGDRYLLPQEGLGFMLSSKQAPSEYARARGSAHQPASNSQGQTRSGATRPSAIAHSSALGHHYAASQALGGALINPPTPSTSLPPEVHADARQESMAETPEVPPDALGFLKNYSPHEVAALYHRWGAANSLLDPTGRKQLRTSFYIHSHYGCAII